MEKRTQTLQNYVAKRRTRNIITGWVLAIITFLLALSVFVMRGLI